jgi:hypothetical protein
MTSSFVQPGGIPTLTGLVFERVPIRTDAASPLPFGRSAEAACPVCRDLDYDLFEMVAEGLPMFAVGCGTRYHVTNMKDIYASARVSCRLCAILYQGMNYYWSVFNGNHNEKPESGLKEESTVNKQGDIENQNLIFLELNPDKSVSLLRAESMEEYKWSCINRLEFHTKPSKHCSASGLPLPLTTLGFSPVHPAFSCAQEVPSHLDLERCVTKLGDWLQVCDTHHYSCFAPIQKLPKRLLQVSDNTSRLVETEGMPYAKYTTLSHCWGKGTDMIKTTRENYDNRILGIDWDELPQIFKDAIAVTLRIDCQWIWIDSLCIIQDDELDWKEESSKMADVYSNSFLNIATTFSASSSGQCFSHRRCHNSSNDIMQGREDYYVQSTDVFDDLHLPSMGLHVRIAHWLGHAHVTGSTSVERCQVSPLLDRAWVFQERLLAPRTLHFGSSEMIWECNSSLACECTEISNYQPIENALKVQYAVVCQDRASQEDILNLWYELVNAYSSLLLTKSTDRAHALAGIASRISAKLRCGYLAGLWAVDLSKGLLWHSVSPNVNGKRPSPSVPTWSWMSQANPERSDAIVRCPQDTKFLEDYIQDHRLRIQWTCADADHTDTNPFVDVPLGQLDLTAAAIPGKIRVDHSSFYYHVVIGDGYETDFIPDYAIGDGLEYGTDVLCVLFGTLSGSPRGLVLKLTSQSGHYTRVGLGYFSQIYFDHAEVKQFVLE